MIRHLLGGAFLAALAAAALLGVVYAWDLSEAQGGTAQALE